ncbi:pilus assembly PilX N-terminal domain-containing protein [Alkalibacterium sp. f15]|uniref:pilus assembly PilX N-terminal domain-containing protein n=1 Tax=Alkalibacterium sp. f15 TaxID=3414029 RepID=UPI003BF86633
MHVKKLVEFMKKDEGSGLILALMTLMVLSVLGASLGAITIGSFKLGDINRDDNSAYYIAEAGANVAFEELEKDVLKVYKESDESNFFQNVNSVAIEVAKKMNSNVDKLYTFEPQFGDQPTVTVVINQVEESDSVIYEIISTGEVAGKKRSVSKSVEVNWVQKGRDTVHALPIPPKDAAIIIRETVTFRNNSVVTGLIYLENENQLIDYYRVSHNGKNNQKLILGNIDWSAYDNVINSFPSQPNHSKTMSYNGESTLVISENTFISSMTINSNISIDTQGKTLFLIVDNLLVNGNINVVGDGKLNVYVTNILNFNSNNLQINKDGNTNQINFLYSGDPEVVIANNAEFNGSLFLKKSNLQIDNNLTVKGAIISGENFITINNNSAISSTIFAPFSNIEFHQNAIINGSVIAKNLTIYNNAKVNYSEHNYEDYPFGAPTETGTETGEINSSELISAEPAIE